MSEENTNLNQGEEENTNIEQEQQETNQSQSTENESNENLNQDNNDSNKKQSQEDDFREVDFLGEKVKVNKSEEKDLIQMGLNYKRKQKEFEEKEKAYSSYTTREKKLLEYVGAKDFNELESIIEQQRIQEEAQKMFDNGQAVDEQQALKMATLENNQKKLEKQAMLYQVQQQNNIVKEQLKNEMYYNEVIKRAEEMTMQNPDIKLEAAFYVLRGKMLPELMKKNQVNQSASIEANIADRAKYGNVHGASNTGSGQSFSISKDMDEFSKIMGNDSQTVYKKYVKRK